MSIDLVLLLQSPVMVRDTIRARFLYNGVILYIAHCKRCIKMVDGWKPVVIPEEIYEVVQQHYEEHKEELKLKHGVRSLTGFINFSIREYLKENGII